MKKVFVIMQNCKVSPGSLEEEAWVYGKRDSAIPHRDLTKGWLSRNGFNSSGAAVRQVRRLPWWGKHPWSSSGATVLELPVPEHELHYEIYRPYEIVIRDNDGNQVGETQYCYGTRAQAEELAEHELTIAEMEV